MNLDAIVGYTFKADEYCPGCVIKQLAPPCFNPVEGTTAEEVLDLLASKRDIDRQDETSFDSGDFPKVVFYDQLCSGRVWVHYKNDYAPALDLNNVHRCGDCGIRLHEVRSGVLA